MYIRQLNVFSFEESLKFDPYDRLVLVLDSLDFEPAISLLNKIRGNGRNDYPIRTMLYCLIGGVVNKCHSIREIIEELHKNPGFRYLCGINHTGLIPTEWAISRFIKNLSKDEFQEALENVFTSAVKNLSKLLPEFGKVTAIDSTHLEAFSKRTVSKPSDPDACWGRKKDAKGNWFHWFGYKLHLLVDAQHELPIAFEATPANANDGNQLIPLMEKAESQQPQINTGVLLADSIYYPVKNYEYFLNKDITLLTPLNKRKQKETEPGFTSE